MSNSRSAPATGGARYKTGLVAQARPGFARVRFPDLDDLTTQWLPVSHPRTQGDRIVWTLAVGEQVSCLLDANMEDGCIVGAIYSEADVPPVGSATRFHQAFSDGSVIEYDTASHVATLQIGGCTITFSSSGITVTGGDVVADGISLKTHVHGGVRGGADQSGPPA